VVGPKGATIKRIQQDTNTYIVTPGRDKDPVFEVIGSRANVEAARREIESYIETRVGGLTADVKESSYGQKDGDDDVKDSPYLNQCEKIDIFSSMLTSSGSTVPYGGVGDTNSCNKQQGKSDDEAQHQSFGSSHFPATAMTPWNGSRLYDCAKSPSFIMGSDGAAGENNRALKNHETWENLINESYRHCPLVYQNSELLMSSSSAKEENFYQKGLGNWATNIDESTAGRYPSLLDFSMELSGNNGGRYAGDPRDERYRVSMADSAEHNMKQLKATNWYELMVNQNKEEGKTTGSFQRDDNHKLTAQFSSESTLSDHITAFTAPSLRHRRGGDCFENLVTGHGGSSCYSPSSSSTESSLSTGSAG